ncbi:Rv0340 family IniB-related protein [Candidatus Mycolicibacterium alkanivorans]|uniref:Rv0340 family protein n=1 Tax=Candidatus Mycolicibacterium alkanivorans TaxID=2954114 RepID=A0ABS9YR79_9MYCO|nr:Rv0340 family IniB-related protein [Candidatus Mycolicibacterium alkanivorans]MCI4673755.1 Rv0340 family protein [Candidatus Mycolicibacterium alkanivorans]
MANSLLDFVMSLVRDPDAAARYAADPAGAIADAHLTDVTSVDVNNLIPMVSDSLSMAAPTIGDAHVGDGNVWASGAATAAFDAFDAHLAAPAPDGHPVITDAIAQPAESVHSVIADAGVDPTVDGLTALDSTSQVVDSGLDHLPGAESLPNWAEHAGWDLQHADDSHPPPHHPGFDPF